MDRYTANLRITDEGTLSNQRAEILAIMVSEGIAPAAAWPQIPGPKGKAGQNDGGSGRYRQRMMRQDAFRARLAMLQEENALFDQDHTFGTVERAATRLYNLSLAQLDLKAMQAATASLLKIAELKANARPSAAEEAELAPPKAGPGRPPVRHAQTKRSVTDIRKELMERGMSEPLAESTPADESERVQPLDDDDILVHEPL